MLDKINSIAASMASAGTKLRGVSLAAAYDDQRAMLRLSWSCGAVMPQQSGGVTMTGCVATDTVVLLPSATEAELLDAAWRLGAWDVLRTEHPPIPRTDSEAALYSFIDYRHEALGDPMHPGWGLTAAFCGSPYLIDGINPSVGDACPQDLLDAAASRGWITWYFRPTRWSVRVGSNNDRTLLPDGSRDERELPITPARLRRAPHQHIYRLGRAPHGNRAKSDRRAV